MMHLHFLHILVLVLTLSLNHQCTSPIAGATTETTNGATGSLRNSDNSPAVNTVVHLFPEDYDPVADAATDSMFIDTTDNNGTFSFSNISSGHYVVLAVNKSSSTGIIIKNIQISDTAITELPTNTLDKNGSISTVFTESTIIDNNWYLYIPGTNIFTYIKSDGTANLDNVPSGIFKVILLANKEGENHNILRGEITLHEEENYTIDKPLWKYKRTITLNTSTDGADIPESIVDFPVLIRLDNSNFDFSQAHSDGSDLLFIRDGSTALPAEIEQWDAAAGNAVLWVTLDTIFGNNATQTITLFWGNEMGNLQPETVTVFDTAIGFEGVWHLGDTIASKTEDASSNRYDGISPDTGLPQSSEGIIGDCRFFNGSTDYITMPNTANSRLNFPEDGYFTISAWVNADTIDHVFRTVVTKGYEQYFLQLSYFPGDLPLWQFSVFREEDNWNMSHTIATQHQWVLLTGVRNGTEQSLYVNGEHVANTSAVYPQDTMRITSNDLSIGRFMEEATFPANFGFCYFKGKIDEVRISHTARNQYWIKLCYMNQREDDKLVTF